MAYKIEVRKFKEEVMVMCPHCFEEKPFLIHSSNVDQWTYIRCEKCNRAMEIRITEVE